MTRAGMAWSGGLLVVLASALALRLPYLTERSLWYDEASSWQTASLPLSELGQSVRLNVHLPLYYILLKGWMAVWGESVAALRGFSIAFGLLTVLAMNLFAREVYRASASGDEREAGRLGFGVIVAGLVAASPFQVLGSIEARMYSLGTALAAISSWLLLRLIRLGHPPRLWWAYGAAVAAFLHIHHYALFTLAAQAVFLALYLVWLIGLDAKAEARTLARQGIIVAGAVALAYLPALVLLRVQAERVRQDYWIHELRWRTFRVTFSEFLVPTHGFDFLLGGQIVFAVAILSCLVVAFRGRRGEYLVLASAIVPMLLAAVVSTIQPIWVARYFRFAHLFLLTAVARAVWKLTRGLPVLRAIAFALVYAVLLGGNVVFWKYLDIPQGGGIRQAVAAILAERRPDEMIVAFDHHQYVTAKYYVGRQAPIRLVAPAGMFWGWHLVRPADLISSDALRGELRRGVWVIANDPYSRLQPELAGAEPTRKLQFQFYMSLHRHLFVQRFALPAQPEP